MHVINTWETSRLNSEECLVIIEVTSDIEEVMQSRITHLTSSLA